MDHKKLLRAGLLTLGLLFGTLPVAFAATNTNTATENTVENTADTAQNQAQGFDDWGLFGLLGLLGLLGLRGRNRSVVVDGTRR